jgi:hypothetical protein
MINVPCPDGAVRLYLQVCVRLSRCTRMLGLYPVRLQAKVVLGDSLTVRAAPPYSTVTERDRRTAAFIADIDE